MTQLCQSNLQCPVSSGFLLSQVGDIKGVLLPRSIHKENPGNYFCAMELLNQDYSNCNCFYYKHIRNNVYKLTTHVFRVDSCKCNRYFYIFYLIFFFSLEVTLVLGADKRLLRPI